ncbi:hypothetical protein [Pedobacter duraquae]|uniref:Uncharacterized protein n=1 Tax=Pedobacter duraquae TaxID=425511 RepID=A0A4R6IIW5_9SPHI|nr:hypothetical protein [Pedobacter duraquae]TDO21930.1 hypothetical protein CLV32_3038 [Pedobacter duraquae]
MSATLQYLNSRIADKQKEHELALKDSNVSRADIVAETLSELRDLKIILENELHKRSKSHED